MTDFNTAPRLTADRDQIRSHLAWLKLPAVEIRGLGRLDDKKLAGVCKREAVELAADLAAPGVYSSINEIISQYPVTDEIRECGLGEMVSDHHIVRLRHLALDIDPTRPKGHPATEAEHEAARSAAETAIRLGRSLGWPEPAMIDSGNGFYVIWKVDLVPEDKLLLKAVVNDMAHRLNTAAAKIDPRVYNPSHVFRIAGTVNRKGANTAERRHRLATIVSLPQAPGILTREQLVAFAGEPPIPVVKAEAATPSTVDDTVDEAALEAMKSVTKNMKDKNDGSKRLYTVACKAIEHNLTDAAALASIKAYAAKQPFAKAWSDAEILHRLRDAEQRGDVIRGSVLESWWKD
jgi:hypothetical protein